MSLKLHVEAVLDEPADLPARHGAVAHGGPQAAAGEQPDVVVRNIRNRIAVEALRSLQLGQHLLHVRKCVAVRGDELLQPGEAAPVELYERPARQAPGLTPGLKIIGETRQNQTTNR